MLAFQRQSATPLQPSPAPPAYAQPLPRPTSPSQSLSSTSSFFTATAPPSTATSVSSQSSFEADHSSLCSHLSTVVQGADDVEGHFRLGVKWGLRLSSGAPRDRASKRRKVSKPQCAKCTATLARPLLCLECGVVLCGSEDGGNHAQEHARAVGHDTFLDLHSNSIYCFACADYVYHPTLERMAAVEEVAYEEVRVTASTSGPKRKRLPFKSWIPSALIFAPLENPSPKGLRNLGQTCYMSVILQSFIHNPLLRAYFLSDRHNRDLCTRALETDTPCLSCELDRLFSESYAADSSACGPTHFLHSFWQSSTELSGYAQQDAHEFVISALNLLHSSTPGSSNADCTCPVHATFAGQLLSRVTCGKCGNITTSADPFLDLSLDLRTTKTAGLPNGVVEGENTLAGCLTRFTRPEQLPPNEYTCAACGGSQHIASKQLSIKKLPPVLNIQLKRFEHTTGAHKIDTPVRFPLKLNMRQYTSASLEKGTGSAADDPESLYEYELFSVVNHEGTTNNNGHYTNFCRIDDDFFCFDDEKVRRVPLPTVLGSQAYLLSYCRRTLGFAA